MNRRSLLSICGFFLFVFCLNSFAGLDEKIIEARFRQTRLYKIDDSQRVIEAIVETNRQLGFQPQFHPASDARFLPARKVDVERAGIPLLFEFKRYKNAQLSVLIRPTGDKSGIYVRVNLRVDQISNNVENFYTEFYALYHKKLADNLFVEGLNIDMGR